MRRAPMLVALALALSPNAEYCYRQGDERVPNELPPIDPNFKIPKPAKSWGRKSKRQKRRG